ncbi:MAG: hypothetical protein ABEJ83_02930 [Candidatus Nanohaloarchaea archaeon]
MSKLGDAMEKFKQQKDKAVKKLPKPLRQKADDKLGLFLHKNIATLFYFDEDIQEIYWEMEEAVQNGDREKASQLSTEMKTLVTMKADPNNGVSTRKHRQAVNKAVKKIEKAQQALEGNLSSKGLKDFLKLKTGEEEDEELEEDIEDMMEEIEDE